MASKKERLDRDGSSASKYFGGGRTRDRRKDAQLCEQVREAISLALAESADPVLAGASAISVDPAPNVTHLRVTIVAPPGADPRSLEDRIDEQSTRLRAEVAAAIHRKKVPSLSFVAVAWPENWP